MFSKVWNLNEKVYAKSSGDVETNGGSIRTAGKKATSEILRCQREDNSKPSFGEASNNSSRIKDAMIRSPDRLEGH